jgi:predicted nuclease of predicted toxin-antitoxin system
MKLLLDENLSRRIIPFVEAHFPGSTQVALIGVERATDEEIWCYARDNGFCIVSLANCYSSSCWQLI